MSKLFFSFLLVVLSFHSFCQTPELFLPEIMDSLPNVRDISISPTTNELYFTAQSYKKEFSSIVFITKNNGKWSKPQVASFSGQYTDIEPAFSPDGLRLYFVSNRPKNEQTKTVSDFDIWYVKRQNVNNEWSNPINIGPPINTNNNEYYPSIAANKNLYFTANYSTGKGKEDIYLATFANGTYKKPVLLSESINTSVWEYNAFVAPDELFLIFSSTGHENNLGGGDLYICYKDNNGNWTKAENLGLPINSPKLDFCPFVDLNSETFYFSSEKTSISKSTTKPLNIRELKQVFYSNPNGLTRIYSIPFSLITK